MASNAASAASMPVFIGVWLPLIFGTLRKPAERRSARRRGTSASGSTAAAFVDGARAVGRCAAALEVRAHAGMRLEALHLVEGAEIRVLVVEPDDEADADLVVLEVVEERAAVGGESIGQPTVCMILPGSCLAGRSPTTP
jgi:hypothetical protein